MGTATKTVNITGILNGLIETCKDGQEGFRLAAEDVNNATVKQFFGECSLQRHKYLTELQELSHSLGEPNPADSTSAPAPSATVAVDSGLATLSHLFIRTVGLDNGDAYVIDELLVADTFAALSAELGTPGADFDALARAHATPDGLNEQLARDLDEAGVYAAVHAGLDAVLARTAPRWSWHAVADTTRWGPSSGASALRWASAWTSRNWLAR